ncbi:TrkH family potassium uptake protein [Pseudanabaena sp. PCC 6802]|uniref:TrkH family potassium uptake protein n=1 Tax=Pseudanabaena sp. PCC 6802 TaxID=118173 RepID=UPI00034727A9|nr:TrkH family potassium uptake protein [Pseudanabaena sp. PCC 6802]
MTPARTICLGFLAVITIGALLLTLPISTSNGQWSNPITALFISTSAVCVTGLAVVDVGKFYSPTGQGFIAMLTQIGGLGYMTATTFLLLLVGRKFSLREKIALQQSLDLPGLRGSVQLVRSIIATTLIFELTGVFLLIPVFLEKYDWGHSIWLAIFHSVSAFNNAGFSLFTNNLMDYVSSPVMNFTITGLIIFGGIGYQVILEAFLWLRAKIGRRSDRIHFSLTFRVAVSTTIALLTIGTLAILLTEYRTDTFAALSWPDKIMAAWFQSVTSRTAGFNTIDNGLMTPTGLFVTIALMFIGASPGGTGGGIKTTTARLLGACTRTTLQGKEAIYLYKRQVPSSLIFKAVGVALGSMLTVIGSTALLSVTEKNFTFIQILFEAVSAFGTVGLSTGITPKVTEVGQLILVATMYIGRVGVLLLIAALVRSPKPSLVEYPEETLLVG